MGRVFAPNKPRFQTDPYWKDLILFHEYFHAENGTGLGASHQTGWTGVIAYLMKLGALITPEGALHTERPLCGDFGGAR
jgi:hypothetical protein